MALLLKRDTEEEGGANIVSCSENDDDWTFT